MVKHIFDRYFLFSKPPEIRTVEGLSAIFDFRWCKHHLCSQTTRATNCATPGCIMFFSLFSAYWLSAFNPRRFPQKHSRGSSLEALAPLLVSSPRSNAFIRHRRRHSSSPNCATPGCIMFFSLFSAYWLSAFNPRRFPQKHSRGSLSDRGTDSAKAVQICS